MRSIDGLHNPKVYHRPQPKSRWWQFRRIRWQSVLAIIVIGSLLSYGIGPRLKSFARQVEIFDLVTNGRYLVLFQNDSEIRASGGFIGSYAIVEAKHGTIKPLYFETNVYKLDDPFSAVVKITPPKALHAAIGDRGWALRDANFAADFRQSAPTILWFFEQETQRLTGQRRVEMDTALGNNYHMDGVIATTMSAFLDILEETGPIAIPQNNISVSKENFFPVVQQVVEKDYFKDPANVATNEPKTILQNLFPIAMSKAQNLPKTVQYRIGQRLLREKKVIIYSRDPAREQTLVDQGWAGALELAEEARPKVPADFLSIVRSSHGGNKSSLDINPIYRYTISTKSKDVLKVKLDITFEHTGTGEWPSGTNREYLRVIVPAGATLTQAVKNGDEIYKDIDIGKEMERTAFGFWLHTQPKTSQNLSLEYTLPSATIDPKNYELIVMRQPGGTAPDTTIIRDGTVLFQGRLTEDRVIR